MTCELTSAQRALEFELDLNEKKQDWEVVVKIPFIDGGRFLSAMESRKNRLTDEERRGNGFGTSTKFSYIQGEPTVLAPALLTGTSAACGSTRRR
ncbi:hypothetical protein C8R46DRAFT_1249192 [Mycena filopes]|nr:hypothetical protein C8R46DRAFT_1249192 [Mycena filopes]